MFDSTPPRPTSDTACPCRTGQPCAGNHARHHWPLAWCDCCTPRHEQLREEGKLPEPMLTAVEDLSRRMYYAAAGAPLDAVACAYHTACDAVEAFWKAAP